MLNKLSSINGLKVNRDDEAKMIIVGGNENDLQAVVDMLSAEEYVDDTAAAGFMFGIDTEGGLTALMITDFGEKDGYMKLFGTVGRELIKKSMAA